MNVRVILCFGITKELNALTSPYIITIGEIITAAIPNKYAKIPKSREKGKR